jgi:hypothetical protein
MFRERQRGIPKRPKNAIVYDRINEPNGCPDTVPGSSPGDGLRWVVCHERRLSYLRRATVREMKEGPSSSVIRSRSQATASCCGQEPWW